MKSLITPFRTVHFALAICIFLLSLLLTTSIALAQETTDIQSEVTDTDTTQNEDPQRVRPRAPVQRIQNTRQEGVTNNDSESTRTGRVGEVRATRAENRNTVTDETQSRPERTRTTLEERREQRGNTSVEVREKDKEEREVKRQERKKERISRFLDNVTRKMAAAVFRLQKLSDRIESRISKFEERGNDMSDARALLEIARSSIEEATDGIQIAAETAQTALENDLSRNAFGEVISELRKSKESKVLIKVLRTFIKS